ncbi:sorting and assembly machinery component 50 homolog isoform X2 [Corticium candelabrum]|nr:sorting and assembly machinery component 50 homolog isoform X2 [Corticium candelabrum]
MYSQIVKSHLQALDIFKSIDFIVDSSHDFPHGYDVILDVEESGRLHAKANSTVALNHELQGMVTFATRNTFGRAETVEANISVGTNALPTYRVQFTKPLQADKDHNVQFDIHRSELEYPWSKYNELTHGLAVNYTLPFALGSHQFGYTVDWRQLKCLSNAVPLSVRENAGHNLKSSIRYSLLLDSRDDPVFPTHGSSFRINTELAGIGGDTKFIKSDTTLQTNVCLPVGSVLSLTASAGLIRSLFGSKTNISDRFFLGGMQSVRGFQMYGVGPHNENCSSGGDAFWAAGAHVFTPLPFQPGKGRFGELFRTHFFITGGNCDALAFGSQWRNSLSTFLSNARWSYGMGVALKLGLARVEINYCIPHRAMSSDRLQSGLQIGVGLDYSC